MNKHSLTGKISFILLNIGFILFILTLIIAQLSSNIYHDNIVSKDTSANIILLILFILVLASFITSLIVVIRKNNSDVLNIITLSITSFIFILFLVVFIWYYAFSVNVMKGVVTNFGLFSVPVISTPMGKEINLYEQRFLIVNTDSIISQYGKHFGFNYVIQGEPDKRQVQIMIVIKTPDAKQNYDNNKFLITKYYKNISLNEINYWGYKIGNNEKLKPGRWQIDIWCNKIKLITKSFIIVPSGTDFKMI